MAFRIGNLVTRDRARLAAILHATAAFRDDEVDIALELFDEAYPPALGARRSAQNQALGARRSALGPAPALSTDGRLPNPESRISSPDYFFLGAFTPDGELAGYVCYGPTPAAERTWDLYWIAVDPAMHRAGVGTTLLSEVERRLEQQQARLLVIETSSRSEYAATRRFYAGRGYTEAARVREFYAPGDDRIMYTKRFHSPIRRGAESP